MAVSVIIDEGKLNLLSCAFGGDGEPFAYMAAGTGLSPPSSASLGLNNECGDANGDYVRAPLVNEIDTENFYIISKATFDVTNITNETKISEIGIVNSPTIGEGTFWAICEVDPVVTKDDSQKVEFTIYTTLLECY